MSTDKIIIGVNPYYKTAYANNYMLEIVSALKVLNIEPSFSLTAGYYPSVVENATITIFRPDESEETFNDNRHGVVNNENLKLGTYRIQYKGRASRSFETALETDFQYEDYSFSYYFSVVENKLPLKKWTITDVINRTLELAEPLRKGENPRFRLNGMRDNGTIITEANKRPEERVGQAAQFDRITAPEFSFTKQTLRECLQEIGKVVHGEPRLKPVSSDRTREIDRRTFTNGRTRLGNLLPQGYRTPNAVYEIRTENGVLTGKVISVIEAALTTYYLQLEDDTYSGTNTVYERYVEWLYEVSYDLYAGSEESDIQYMPYNNKGTKLTIESYASHLDSHAQNLVNQLDKYGGVIVEPYRDGAKTVRTENLYVRIEDGNMIIATQFPIFSIEKLEYFQYDTPATGGGFKGLDITPYVFEKTIYDTQLSSYAQAYPYSKAYGLYYKQGEKNIGGLNFKLDAASFAVYQNYAIINIINQASGGNISTNTPDFYPKMCFRITYTPIYNVRVAQTKPYYKDFKRPAGLIFNQQSNVVESRYYGENMKGAIARLGNIDKTKTFKMYKIRQVPRAGMRYDKDYYISAVALSVMGNCLICTIGLTKDFNRLSQYIGVSSAKRYYEVSEKQALERNTLYREYVVIGDAEVPDSDALVDGTMLGVISWTFKPPVNEGEPVYISPITNVCAWGTTKSGEPLNAVNLPVISSAFGNSISFSWQYEDNYSAGAASQKVDNAFTDGASGYFMNSCRYTDFYGRLYYYNFDLQLSGDVMNAENVFDLPAGEVPSERKGVISTIGKTPYIMRKDNREALQVNFQIDFVTNKENIIIGSALASYCPAVRGTDATLNPKLYVLPIELNKFTDNVEAFNKVDLSLLPSAEIDITPVNGRLQLTAENFPASGKSWAIVTEQYEKTTEVEDEDGNKTTQTEIYGGNLLLGQNIEVQSGQAFNPIYFTPKREIFDKSVWKNRR